MMQLTFTTHKPISAIYFALLQCGYEFYSLDRDEKLTECLRQFAAFDSHAFFTEVKQTTCDAYPYWPRAAILESAAFCLTDDLQSFADFDAFVQTVKQASNLTDAERTQELWDWLAGFPRVLSAVMHSDAFVRYYAWEHAWLGEQQTVRKDDLQKLQALLSRCTETYNTPIARVQIVQNPIKCVYSADYHIRGDCLTVVSGAFSLSNVIHEFLHTAVHPFVIAHQDAIQNSTCDFAELDPTYRTAGKLNAFEEYAVRKLTEQVMNGEYPDLQAFLE
ncbi:MAG: hypothetical protein IJD82_02515 [Clostridia bacterium]|nr:hypothetical protein [Clostridia bacterium]